MTTASAADTTVTVADAADMYTSSQAPNTGYATSTSLAAYGTPAITSVMRFGLPAAPAGRPSRRHDCGSARRRSPRRARPTPSTCAPHRTPGASPRRRTPPVRPWAARCSELLPGRRRPTPPYWINLDASALRPLSGATTLAVQGTGNDSFWFWSRRHTTASYRPLLELTYTDTVEPPSDTTAPTTPAGLTSDVTGGNVALSWSASTDDTAVTGYNVHRSTTDDFTPTTENRIATPTGTSYVDQGRPSGTWHYRVVARDAAGNTSAPSTTVAATVATLTQTTSTVLDAADMYVSANTPNDNFGTGTSLSAYGTPSVTSYLRFVVPAGPDGASLTGARLRFRTSNIASAGTANTLNVRTASDSWNETTTTYATRPSVGSVVGTRAGAPASDTTYWMTARRCGARVRERARRRWRSRAPAPTACGCGRDATLHGEPSSAGADVVGRPRAAGPGGSRRDFDRRRSGRRRLSARHDRHLATCKHAEVRALMDSVAPDRFIATGDLAQGLGSY